MNFQPHDNGTYLVESSSHSGEHYIVDPSELTCSCDAFTFGKHRGQMLCKHLRAIFGNGVEPAKVKISTPILLAEMRKA